MLFVVLSFLGRRLGDFNSSLDRTSIVVLHVGLAKHDPIANSVVCPSRIGGHSLVGTLVLYTKVVITRSFLSGCASHVGVLDDCVAILAVVWDWNRLYFLLIL